MASDHELVADDAQTEDVGAVVERLTTNLLRRHVRHRTSNEPRSRHGVHERGRVGGLRHRRGDPEIQHLDDPPRREHDIGRLDVAMHDAMPMRFAESQGDLSEDRDRVGLGRLGADEACLRAIVCASVSPSTYDITMKPTPSASEIS